MKKSIIDLFKKIKLLVLDVDGVLTKGEIIYDSDGKELKIFNVKDGLGVYLLGRAGIKTVLLTAKNSDVVHRRAQDMHVAEVIANILPKEKALPYLTKKYNVSAQAICFVGDDLIDIATMQKVGLSAAVADAAIQVKKAARYITKKKGGQGAVREIVDLIISAQDLSAKIDHAIRNPVKQS